MQNLYHSGGLNPAQSQLAKAGIQRLNNMNHIFRKARHNMGELVKACGSKSKAYDKLNNAAQEALRKGKLNLKKDGVNTETLINVNGVDVILVGGRVVNGRFILASASRSRL